MDAQQILQSDALDILFSGRNKAYGAYALRKTYNKRIIIALSGTLTLVCLMIVIQQWANRFQANQVPIELDVPTTTISKYPTETSPPPPPPPAKLPPPPPVASVKYATPDIVDDDKVIEPPPEVKKILEAKIDLKTIEGTKFIGIIAPPSKEIGTNIIAGPVVKKQDEDVIIYDVQIEASFPGGPKAWARYVRMAIEAELGEFAEEDYGTVMVKFVVDKSGNVSQVHALNMRGTTLAEVAVNAIRKGPKWIPAQQNGQYVNAYRLQAVTLTNPNL